MHAEENVKNLELCSARLCCVLYAALRQVADIQQLTWLLGAAAAGSRAAGGTEAGSSGGSAAFLLAYARLADAWAALQTADSQASARTSRVTLHLSHYEVVSCWLWPKPRAVYARVASCRSAINFPSWIAVSRCSMNFST
jgi:hypothetical protein